jgi:hypothetical protein
LVRAFAKLGYQIFSPIFARRIRAAKARLLHVSRAL